jgi:hypothetical protein
VNAGVVVRQNPAPESLTGSSSATLSADGRQVTVTLTVTNPNTVEATAFSAQLAATGVTGTPVPFGPASIPAGDTVVLTQTFSTSNTGLPTFTITGGQATVGGSTVLLSPATVTSTAVGSSACDSLGRDVCWRAPYAVLPVPDWWQAPNALTATASVSPASVTVGGFVAVQLVITNPNPEDVTYDITGTATGTAATGASAVFSGTVPAGQTVTVTQPVQVTGAGSLGFSFTGAALAGATSVPVGPIPLLVDTVTAVVSE